MWLYSSGEATLRSVRNVDDGGFLLRRLDRAGTLTADMAGGVRCVETTAPIGMAALTVLLSRLEPAWFC
jgi:hypothetical protein